MKVKQELTRAVGLNVLSVNEEERYIDFVISNDKEDNHGTVFRSDKWRLDRYNSNPVFTFNHHDHTNDPDDTLGTSEIRFEDGNMIARAYFEDGNPDGDNNQKADKVFRKAKKGTLRGASIRATVYDASFGDESRGENPEVLYFNDHELMAWSVVTVPSNAEALSRNASQLNEIKETITPQAANATSDDTEEKRTMSRFEAQMIINKN